MNYFAKAAVHVALVFCAFVLAYALRRGLLPDWWLSSPEAPMVLGWAAIYAAMALVYEAIFRIERGAWRFSSAHDVVRLAQSTALTALSFLALIFLTNRAITLPRSTLILSWVISLFALVGVRLVWRLALDRSLAGLLLPRWGRGRDLEGKGLILIGDVATAEAYLRRHRAGEDRDYAPLAIISKSGGLTGQQVLGVPVVGAVKDLERLAGEAVRSGERAGALLFLDDPTLNLGLRAEQVGRLRAAGWRLLRQPSVAEFGQGASLKEMKLEDFLSREPIALDPAKIEALVRGRRVMVTGAGGSIGSEICRQLIGLRCAHLTMVDHSEFLLFEIDRELAGLSSASGRRAVLANVRDKGRIGEVMRLERPEIVFHAAALKHVALVEENPAEGVLTNVLGTWNVLRAAIAAEVGQFVLVSTDKAVAPTNVMGATKRLAESLLELAQPGATRLAAVRFGNVLGSAGSVVPVFQDQIARGGPVTVTDPEVSRYFMTIPEAVQLVLHSTAISATQPALQPRKFVLEMGEPVKIVDLARQMIMLSGAKPDDDMEIVFTGLKDGEKMAEVLFDADEEPIACVEGIMEIRRRARGAYIRPAEARVLLEELEKPDEIALITVAHRLIARLRKPQGDAVSA